MELSIALSFLPTNTEKKQLRSAEKDRRFRNLLSLIDTMRFVAINLQLFSTSLIHELLLPIQHNSRKESHTTNRNVEPAFIQGSVSVFVDSYTILTVTSEK